MWILMKPRKKLRSIGIFLLSCRDIKVRYCCTDHNTPQCPQRRSAWMRRLIRLMQCPCLRREEHWKCWGCPHGLESPPSADRLPTLDTFMPNTWPAADG